MFAILLQNCVLWLSSLFVCKHNNNKKTEFSFIKWRSSAAVRAPSELRLQQAHVAADIHGIDLNAQNPCQTDRILHEYDSWGVKASDSFLIDVMQSAPLQRGNLLTLQWNLEFPRTCNVMSNNRFNLCRCITRWIEKKTYLEQLEDDESQASPVWSRDR